MFSRIGPWEVLLILVVVLLIFGPAKLPQLGKSIGESLREFKKSMRGVTEEANEEPNEAEKKD